MFDFGIYLDALVAFFGDRSEVARKAVKCIRIAREIPCDDIVKNGMVASNINNDPVWMRTCEYMTRSLTGLRDVDLTIWSANGSTASFPSGSSSAEPIDTGKFKELEKSWKDWEWTSQLLEMDALRKAKITWWGFHTDGNAFDSWLAGRMVADRLVRNRMVKDGAVIEGVVMVNGKA